MFPHSNTFNKILSPYPFSRQSLSSNTHTIKLLHHFIYRDYNTLHFSN